MSAARGAFCLRPLARGGDGPTPALSRRDAGLQHLEQLEAIHLWYGTAFDILVAVPKSSWRN